VFDPACGSGNFLVIAYKSPSKKLRILIKRLAWRGV
jgi:type I restriction-modification system DNA methylase subunit